MKKVMGVVAMLALILIVVWCAFPGHLRFKRSQMEKRYRAAGYTMKPGCNASWANQATIKLWSLSNELEEAQQLITPDTNEVLRLKQEIIAAQEELAFRDEDCRQRGHADTIPVKFVTNSPPQ